MKLNVYDTPAAASQAAAEAAAGILREAIAARGGRVRGCHWQFPARVPEASDRCPWDRLGANDPVSPGRVHRDPVQSPGEFPALPRGAADEPGPRWTRPLHPRRCADLSAELARLNAAIAATAIDVAFIGIGENGHIAFNDPRRTSLPRRLSSWSISTRPAAGSRSGRGGSSRSTLSPGRPSRCR